MKFKNVFRFIVSVFICAAFSFSVQAEDKTPIQAQLMLSNLGFGASVGYHINDMIFIGADFSSISLSDEQTEGNETVDVDLNFSTQILMCRVSPFSGAFFVQGGLVNRSWEVEADGMSEIGNSGQSARVKATLKFPSIAANLGIGWNWISDFGLSGGLGLGMITGGKPDVDMETDHLVAASVPADQIKKEEENLESDVEKYATFPYIHLNIGWNF